MALSSHSLWKFLNTTEFQNQGRAKERRGAPGVGIPHTAGSERDPSKLQAEGHESAARPRNRADAKRDPPV